MEFIFGLSKDAQGNTGIVVFVDRLTKMAYLAAVPDTIDGDGTAMLFIDRVFRQHGFPVTISLTETLASLGSFGSSSSRFSAHVVTWPRQITRRLMVKPSESIALSVTYYAAFALMHQNAGARCFLLLSLR